MVGLLALAPGRLAPLAQQRSVGEILLGGQRQQAGAGAENPAVQAAGAAGTLPD